MHSDAKCAFAGLPLNVTELHSQHDDRRQPKYVLTVLLCFPLSFCILQTDRFPNVVAMNNLTIACIAARL